jgi:hypothetical protein
MILVWRGVGLFVAVIWVASMVAGVFLADVLFGKDTHARVAVLTGSVLAALLTLPLAWLVRRGAAAEKAGAARPDAGPPESHDLFFVPVGWWPLIFVVLGVACYFGLAPSRGRL